MITLKELMAEDAELIFFNTDEFASEALYLGKAVTIAPPTLPAGNKDDIQDDIPEDTPEDEPEDEPEDAEDGPGGMIIRVIIDENKDRLGDGTSDATISGLVSELSEPEHNSTITCDGKAWRVAMVISKDELVWRAVATRDERFRMK